jgi:hypothetical protein
VKRVNSYKYFKQDPLSFQGNAGGGAGGDGGGGSGGGAFGKLAFSKLKTDPHKMESTQR